MPSVDKLKKVGAKKKLTTARRTIEKSSLEKRIKDQINHCSNVKPMHNQDDENSSFKRQTIREQKQFISHESIRSG